MERGFDCYGPVTAEVAAQAAAEGFSFVGRYYGTGGKLLKRDEAECLSAAGLSLIVYFERTAARALGGRDCGLSDGALALSQARAVGQPTGTPIYAAVDFDAPPSSDNIVKEYFSGFKAALGLDYRTGVYGGGAVCQMLLAAGLVAYATLAGAMGWRGSAAFAGRENIRQFPTVPAGGPRNPLGIAIDPLESASLDDAGAWRLGTPASASRIHRPIRLGHKNADVAELQRRLIAKGFDVGPAGADGWYGRHTDAAFWAWAWTELSR